MLRVQMRSLTLRVLKGWGDTQGWLPQGNVAQEGGGQPRTPLGQPDCAKKQDFCEPVSQTTEDCQRPPLLSGNLQALTRLHLRSIFSLVKSNPLLCTTAPLEGLEWQRHAMGTERARQWSHTKEPVWAIGVVYDVLSGIVGTRAAVGTAHRE